MSEHGSSPQSVKTKQATPPMSSTFAFATVFKHADAVDVALMVVGLLGAIGDGVSTPAMLAITSRVFDDAGTGPDRLHQFLPKMNENVRYTLYLGVAHGIAAFLEGYCWTRTAERQASRMRLRYLRAVLRQDVEYFDLTATATGGGAATTSDVVTSVSADSLAVQDALSEKLPNFLMNCTAFVAGYGVALLLLWQLALAALPSVLLLVVPGFLYARVQISLARRIREQYARPGAVAEQAVAAVRTVYSFVAERSTAARFAAALDESVRLGLRQGLAKGLALGSGGIRIAILAFTVWYGSRLVMYRGCSAGTVYNVAVIIVYGGGALGTALSNIKYLSEASAAAERITELIRRVPKIDSESVAGDVLDDVTGDVEFKNVEFCYPSRPESPVFVDFSLRVPAGRTVALVGGSGSGKSTVIALLERFYDPAAGEVTLDGVDIRRLRLKWLRARMGLVSQEPALFATTIRENILLGKEDATEEEVVAAAKAANAHSFISQLPQGYDTLVGERGIQMSGGQKQRIAIARAILKSPKILLLDEATSALDTNSELVVQEALDLASMGRTTIIIAHRLSTIRNVHLIAVMKSGEIKELGSHDELIADENGLYSTLVHLQQTRDSTETAKVGRTRTTHAMLQPSSQSKGSPASRSSSTRSVGDVNENGNKETPKLPVPSFMRLLMLNAPEWKQGLMGCFSAIVSGGIQPVFGYIMGSMISIYFSTNHEEIKEKTRIYALISISLAVLTFLVNIGQYYNFASMGEHLTKRVREQMLTKFLTFEIGWFDRDENSSGSICSQLTNDANIVRSLVGDRMSLVLHTVSAVLTAYIMGLAITWHLAILMIAVQPFTIMCYYTRYVLLKSMSKKSKQAQSECSKLAAEAVSNFRTITAFSSQNRIIGLFDKAQEGPRKENIRQSWFAGIGLGTSVIVLRCTWAFTFWYSGMLMDGHHITAKAFFQTFLILVSTSLVIADAGAMTTDLAKGAAAVASVFAILDRETKIEPDSPKGYKPEKLKGEVDIRGVDFSYPSRPDVIVFKRFSLSIQPAKSTALVGQSGSGKSTIIGLIERFYDPTSGVIEIDRKDIKAYNLRSLRQHIGLVSQEPTLFAGTIRENIVYGTELANQEEIENAARSANVHDFISSLKDGYETRCGEQGVQLSGGQKQRIAIARAILKNPAILLLDEATSALDSQSEKLVQEALDRMLVGRTSVVVAHRLSTIQNCDMIIVLEKGVVVETGTHTSLMAMGPSGTYFGLANLQQGGNQVNNAMVLQENSSIPDFQP